MSNGRFRLQRVLDVRRIIEKEKQKILSVAMTSLMQRQEELASLLDKKSHFADRMDGIRKGNANTFSARHSYLATLTDQIEDKRCEVVKTEGEVKAKRQDLLKATQEKKALEKLEEKNAEAFRAAQTSLEQQFLDEIAMRRETY